LVDVQNRVDPVGVWAVEHEEVRVPGDQRAEVGLRAVAPLVAEVTAAGAVYVNAGEVVGGLESGAVDDGVDTVFDAVDGAHPPLGQVGDGGRFQADVGQRERGVPLA